MMKNPCFIFLFLMLAVQGLQADPLPSDKGMSIHLPVDWVSTKRSNLVVTIPSNYESLQPLESFGTEPMIEFVPKGQNGENYSEIITLFMFRNKRIPASWMSEALRQNLKQTTPLELLFEETTPNRAIFVVSYEYNGSKEVMGALYQSGPFDCAGLQYTIRLKKGESPKDGAETIKQFFADHSRVIKD